MIRDYMGTKHAFYFAFMYVYTAFLYYLMPLSLAQMISQFIPPNKSHPRYIGFEGLACPIMAIVMTLTSTAFLKYWKRTV